MSLHSFDQVRPFDFNKATIDQQDRFLDVLSAAYPDDEVAELWDNDDQLTVELFLPDEAEPVGALVIGTDLYPRCWINRIAIAPGAQRAGLGRLAVEFAELIATHEGFEELHVKTWSANRHAVGFYGALGFELSSSDDDYTSFVKAI